MIAVVACIVIVVVEIVLCVTLSGIEESFKQGSWAGCSHAVMCSRSQSTHRRDVLFTIWKHGTPAACTSVF